MKYLLTALCCLAAVYAHAQGFAINTNGSAAHNSAMLDVTSTSKGILIPRVSTAQRTAIASPATGLMVYDSTLNQFAYYNGGSWQLIGTGAGGIKSKIQDADSTTRVETERNPNEELIRYTLNGVEYFKMRRGVLEINNTGGSVFLGDAAGFNENYDFNYNTGIGANALQNCDSCSYNVAVGRRSLQFMTGDVNYVTGLYNTAIGMDAMRFNTNGNNNTAIGQNALGSNTGSSNTAVGYAAGMSSGAGAGNVFLGNAAGQNETGSNKLYISNSNTSTPLIHGDFTNRRLTVNDRLVSKYFQMTNGAANGYVLQSNVNGAASWVNPAALSITETDPQVSSATTNYIPRWNGATLVDGQIFDNGANVGVGTGTPASRLHISSNNTVTNTTIESGNQQYPTALSILPSTHASSRRASVKLDDWQILQDVAGTGSKDFTIYQGAAGLQRITIGTTGNVGIGINAPSERLEVNGKTKTANIQVTNGATNGYILQSDATGNGSWVNPASLSITETDPQVSSSSANYIPKWNGTTLVDGQVFDNGTNIGVGTNTPTDKMHVVGNVKVDAGKLPFVNTGNSVFIGENAGAADDLTDNRNVFIGADAGKANTTGFNAVAIGYAALSKNTTGANNISLGNNALANNTTGANNIAMGDSALNKNTNAAYNLAIGSKAGKNITTGFENVYLGHLAGENTTTGYTNVAIGNFAMQKIGGGYGNIALGNSSLAKAVGASSNIAIGYEAAFNKTSGDQNTVIGDQAMYANTSGSYNTVFGSASLQNNTNGGNNVAIGASAGSQNVSGSNNIFLGTNAGYFETGSNKLYIDNSNTASPLVYGNFAADSLKVNGTLTVNNAYTFPSTAGTANYVLQTNGTGQASWVNPAALSITETDPQVSSATTNYTPKWNGTTLVDGQVFDDGTNIGIGTATPAYTLTIEKNSAIFYIKENTTGSAVALLPPKPGISGGVGTATNDDFPIFTNGGDKMTIKAAGEVGIGTSLPADKLHVVGSVRVQNGKIPFVNSSNSVYIGNNAGLGDNFSGVLGNTAVGTNSLSSNVSGFSNTAIGYEAMRFSNVTGGAENTAVGAWAFRSNISGTENAVFGSGAGINNISGSKNTFIGRFAGRYNTGSGNVFLGYQSGQNEAGSDKLYIDNSSTASPLIYGNFAADSLKVNGSLTVNNAYTFPSTAGTANYVLQTNGAGQASWVNPASLSITEADPQVTSAVANYIPKWNGTTLTDGLLYDNGTNIGLGVTNPLEKFHVKGSAIIEQGRLAFRNTGRGVFVGENAGLNDDMNTNRSTFVGYSAGQNNISGNENVAVGARALYSSVSGSNFCTAIGNSALEFATGTANTALGAQAGQSASGSFNVFIGTSAGMSETGSNKLVIANNSTTALIRGDFATGEVSINGNVGIGIATPTRAKMEVIGSQSHTLSYGYLSSSGNTGTASGTNNYSIYASNRIAASEFNAFSDARIKNIKGVSNSSSDLQTLMNIEITNYKLKDSISKGNSEYKKVIAQQVEKVYPQAVSKMTDVVPDIYKQADIKEGVINLATTLKAGDKVKLIFEGGEEMVAVTAVSATSFTVDAKNTGKVFVFGKEVNDFRTVDYEALSTLNISATQELNRHLQQQKEIIQKQQQQIDKLMEIIEQMRQGKSAVTSR